MKKSLCLLCLTCGILPTAAQPFQNLGFDDANTNNVTPAGGSGYHGPTSELLPGWQENFGSIMGLNLFPVGGTMYDTLVTSNGTFTPYNNLSDLGYPVSGLYHLQLGIWNPTGPFLPYILSQVGDVPADARSIHFFTYGSPFELSVNGSLVPLIYNYLPNNTPAPVFTVATVAADISAFAGQTVELKFTTLNDPGIVYKTYGLDGIFFSTQVVPEPGVFSLLALGSLLLGWRFWKR